MDRPIALIDLSDVGNTSLGVKILQAPIAQSLQTQLQAAIDAAAASDAQYAMVQGLELGGSGSGATWRAMLTLTENQGWGFNTSVPCAIAKVYCAEARDAAEIETVLGHIYAAIAAAATNDPFVWQPRIAGSGRDGTYMVCVLWADGSPGQPTISVQSTAQQGPYTAAQTVASLTIPQSVNGLVATQQFWFVRWGVVLNDATGSGAKARLELNSAPLVESDEIGAAAEWQANSSVYVHTQSTVAPSVFDLIVEPTVPGLAINCRGIYLVATQQNYNLALT